MRTPIGGMTSQQRRLKEDILARVAEYRGHRDAAQREVDAIEAKPYSERTSTDTMRLTLARERLAANREALSVLWELNTDHLT